MSEDLWIHRARNMHCSFCMWYLPKREEGKTMENTKLGRCRRHAPTMNGFPVMYPHDWCGDHRLDETKIS